MPKRRVPTIPELEERVSVGLRVAAKPTASADLRRAAWRMAGSSSRLAKEIQRLGPRFKRRS